MTGPVCDPERKNIMPVEQRRLRPTDSLFFALFPDAPAAERIENFTRRLCADHRIAGKPLASKRFHISLHHLGNFRGLPPQAVLMAEGAAASITVPPFELVLDHVISFKSKKADNRPLVLGLHREPPSLTELHQILGAALREAGFGQAIRSRFKPHLTLLYGDHQIAQDIEPIAWMVREFVLVHSLLGKTRYIPLGRWRLR